MAVDIGSSSVSLTWFTPIEPNGIILFYRVVARQVEDSTAEIVVHIPASMSTSDIEVIPANKSDMLIANTSEDMLATEVFIAFTLMGLSPQTVYVITVQANTSAGYGNRSEELHITTDPGVCVGGVWMNVCVCVVFVCGDCVHMHCTFQFHPLLNPHTSCRSLKHSHHYGTSSRSHHSGGFGSTCHSSTNSSAMPQMEKEDRCPCG